MLIDELDAAIRAVCPIDGINTKGVIWFRPEATDEQKAAAQEVMALYLPQVS